MYIVFVGQVTHVDKGGPCDGHVFVNDILTHVDSERVDNCSKVAQLCSKAWKVILNVTRHNGILLPFSMEGWLKFALIQHLICDSTWNQYLIWKKIQMMEFQRT